MLGRIINQLEEGVIAFLLVGMTLLVFVEVVMRFGFNAGFLWSQELTLNMSAWMVLFGASYGVKVGSHIGVDTFVKKLAPENRRWITMFAVFLCLIYCGLILYGGWIYLSKIYSIGIEMEDIPVKKWIAHSILFIGYIMLGLRFTQLLVSLFRGQVSGFKLADEAGDALRDAQKLREEDELANGKSGE